MEKITSRKNPLCAHIKKLGASKSYRIENREFLCDGLKLLEEAANNEVIVKTVLTCGTLPFMLPPETRVCFTTRDIIDSISPLKNAQDTLFICDMPDNSMVQTDGSCREFLSGSGDYILLDGLQDPGNVGTIIRTANALGITGVMLYGKCADLFNPKTIRATMGALFKQKVFTVGYGELSALKEKGATIIGASIGDNCRDITKISLNNSIIAIGSEGCGLSNSISSLCEELITIPISSDCDSLNAAVAASIIMWEIERCLH